MIKRYDAGCYECCPTEEKKGEWVKWEDVEGFGLQKESMYCSNCGHHHNLEFIGCPYVVKIFPDNVEPVDMSNPDLLIEIALPNWETVERVHDWRNYITEKVRKKWHTLSLEFKLLAYDIAKSCASREEWE